MGYKFKAVLLALLALLCANSAGAQQINQLPNNASVPLPAGTCFIVDQAAAGGTFVTSKLCGNYPAAIGAAPAGSGGGGGGGGTLSNVGLTVPPASIFSVGNSPLTSNGNLNLLTSGNAGGLAYFSSSSQLSSSNALVNGAPILGGGVGGPPVSGNISGNSTTLVSQGVGSTTAGHALVYDSSGNAVDGGAFPGGVSSVGLSAPTGFGVSGSPVTSTGTLGLTLNQEPANSVWAGPTSGPVTQPTFRALVVNDIPAGIPLSDLAAQSGSTVVGNATVGTAVPTTLVMPSCADTSGSHLNFVPGTGFTCGNTSSSGSPLSGMTATQIPVAASATTVTSSIPQSTWLFSAAGNSALTGAGAACLQADATGAISRTAGTCATGGSGSVTNVAETVPAGFTISGSPITTSGTLAIGLSTEAANTVWAGPTTGAAAAPTFRAMVANDLPSAGVHTLGSTSISLGSTTTSVAGLSLAASPNLALRDSSAAFDLSMTATSSPVLTATRGLIFDVENGTRTIHLGSNVTFTNDPGGVTGALKSNGSGSFSQASCADLVGAGTGCSSSSFASTTANNTWLGNNAEATCTAPKVGTGATATFTPPSGCAISYITIDTTGQTINVPASMPANPLPPPSSPNVSNSSLTRTLDITYTGSVTPVFGAGAQWPGRTAPVACAGSVTTNCLSAVNGAHDRVVGQSLDASNILYGTILTNYGTPLIPVGVVQSVTSGATGNTVNVQQVTVTGFVAGHTALLGVKWCSVSNCSGTGSIDVSSIGVTGTASCTAITGAAFFTSTVTSLRLYQCSGMSSGSVTFTAHFASNVNFVTVVASELSGNAGAEGGTSNSGGSGNPSITTGALTQSSGEAVFMFSASATTDPTGISTPASGGTFIGFGGYGWFLTTTSGAQTMTFSGAAGAWQAVGAGLTHN